MRSVAIASAAVALTLAGAASAHGPGQQRRAPHSMPPLARRSTTPTEESEAQITSSAEECTYYYLPEVNTLLQGYPTIWQTATIPAADTDAMAIFTAMNSSIPNISPRGTRAGDFTGVTYDTSTDDACWWTDTKCTTPKISGIPSDITMCAEPKTWGYTFDDGPNCTHNAFYDFLLEKNQKATMFYIGSNVMDWPLQAQRGLIDGHHLLGHTWSHPYMTALTNEEVFAELYYSTKAIKDVTGVTVDAWRPPYGDIDDRVRYIATALGLKSILWSDDTFDWEVEPAGTLPKSTVEQNYQNIIGNVSDEHGVIVLTHEINADTMSLAMDEYPTILNSFNIVPLTACMNWTNPYAEDITYPDFASYMAGSVDPSGLPAASALTITDASYTPVGTGSSAVAAAGKATDSAQSSAAKAASTASTASSKSKASAQAANASTTSTTSGASAVMTQSTALVAMLTAVFAGAGFVFLA